MLEIQPYHNSVNKI